MGALEGFLALLGPFRILQTLLRKRIQPLLHHRVGLGLVLLAVLAHRPARCIVGALVQLLERLIGAGSVLQIKLIDEPRQQQPRHHHRAGEHGQRDD